jgi:SAM-dependent methyltransferase
MPVSALVLLDSPAEVAAKLEAAGYTVVVGEDVPADITSTVLIGHGTAGSRLPALAEALGNTTALIYVDADLPTVHTRRWPQAYLLLTEAYRETAQRLRAAGPPVVERLGGGPEAIVDGLGELLDQPRIGLSFGGQALAYDEVRPSYPDGIVAEALAYAGHPTSAVEVGAGTGKATEVFARRGLALTCVEPDPQMAAVLRRRFADRPAVTVHERRFEEWTPPAGGVGLLYFATSWHWADPQRRTALAHATLRPGGTLALFENENTLADDEQAARIHDVYDRVAPQLRIEPGPVPYDVREDWSREITAAGGFADVTGHRVAADYPCPTPRYLRLLGTFSSHISIGPARRRALHDGIATAAGDVVALRLITTLVLARSVAD